MKFLLALISAAILALAIALFVHEHRPAAIPSPHVGSPDMQVLAVGFFDAKSQPPLGGPFAHVRVHISPPDPQNPGDLVTLTGVTLYGKWSDTPVKDRAVLESPDFVLRGVASPKAGAEGPWDSGWVRGPSDDKEANPLACYSLLVVAEFYTWGSDAPVLTEQVRVVQFEGLAGDTPRVEKQRTPWIQGTKSSAGGGGQAGPTVTAAGTFFGTQHCAVYDVHLEYDPGVPSNQVQSVVVTAGPATPAVSYLGTMPNPPPPSDAHLTGYYDSTKDAYYLRVSITVVGTNPSTPWTELTFSGIKSHQGIQIRGH